MDGREWLAQRFEESRSHLRAVAYRMLGAPGEADDAVQEAWLRLSRSNAAAIENLGAWLTTVVARICLDMLRSRQSRREEPLDTDVNEPAPRVAAGIDPEQETLLADSVGLAVLVVLDRLAPAERVAFVLHDTFGVSFGEIAAILGRTPAATRQLASRARRRVRGAPPDSKVQGKRLAEQRRIVGAFLDALRAGDFAGLVAVLDPGVVARVDEAAALPGAPREIRGALNWARGAMAFSRLAQMVQPMLIDGEVGLVWAPRGRLRRALRFTIAQGKIAQIDVVADPPRLRQLDLAVLPD